MKNFKNSKGITLIALIITIIVMLILVGVTINVALNGGLFRHAENAVIRTEAEKNAEQQLASGKIKIGGKWYASIDDYIAGNAIEQSLMLDNATLELNTGTDNNVATLTAIQNKIQGEITWTSSDTTKVSVEENGLIATITAVAEGTAIITASCTFEEIEYKATCTVTVSPMLISNSDSYVGYYANLDNDPEPEGIIFADLAVGGRVLGLGEYFTIETEDGLKSYTVSENQYKNEEFNLHSQYVITVAEQEGNDRFYVMALEDLDDQQYCWYFNALDTTDYLTATSVDFGKGYNNTSTMMGKYGKTIEEGGYGEKTDRDMWGVIGTAWDNGNRMACSFYIGVACFPRCFQYN